MVDRTLVLRKIGELEICQKQIQEFSEITVAEYMADWKAQRVVERTLQMMIEMCVDIANHIVSDRGMRTPVSYADTFKVLSENSIIDSQLFSTMERMAKFRNVVVHQYERVDAEIVIVILRKHLGDFERYRDAILTHLKNLEM